MLDVFVPQTLTGSDFIWLLRCWSKGSLPSTTFHYTDNNRDKLKKYEDEESLLNYLRRQGPVQQFIRYADSKGETKKHPDSEII